MKTYCALGLGNNFFYPLGTDSIPIPSNLLQDSSSNSNTKAIHTTDGEETTDISTDPDTDLDKTKDLSDDDESEEVIGTHVSLLPINPNARGTGNDIIEEDREFATASEWLQSHLPNTTLENNTTARKNNKYSSNVQTSISCGATHTSIIVPKDNNNKTTAAVVTGEAHLVGTIFGHTYAKLTIQPTRLPLKVVRISSGRRHVLALTEGATSSSSSSGPGGVVLSWGAGHFGQLGHGPDLTSCLEPRIVERLLPHVVGGNIIEIAAGGLHSAAIVVSTSTKQKVFPSPFASNTTNGDSSKDTIIIRETKTFAWGSNRKGQCGIEGGKCATVPEPLPVVMVKRGEMSKKDNSCNSKTLRPDPVDKNVHFEKLSLGRLHTVALTAYGEVFTWGSTSMGRCGHSSMDSGRGSDRRFVQQPRHVSALRNVAIEAIAAGAAHTLALSRGGRVFSWGAGSDGQCGQGHAGNLFTPRAVQGLPSSASSATKSNKPKVEDVHVPKVNSKVAMAVTMEEEALSKALAMSQITPASETPKTGRIVSIRASGCYSAAITAEGEVWTWGYGSGSAIGHPIPNESTSLSHLPLIPIIEGNQYSTATAAKVYPEGGSDENKIRDCRCFDTDLNIMLPRKVECIETLGVRCEDVSLGPGHMVLLCSVGDNSEDANEVSNDGLPNEVDLETSSHSGDSTTACSADGLSSLKGIGSHENSSTGDIGTTTTFDSNESSKSEKRRRSPGGWMTKIKSSRSNKQNTEASAAAPDSSEKKKSASIRQMGKNIRGEVTSISKALRRGGDKS